MSVTGTTSSPTFFGTLKHSIIRRPLYAFLITVYALAVISFLPPLLSNIGFGILPFDLPGAEPFVLLVTLEIALVAFLVTSIATGKPGVRALRRQSLHWRVGFHWYLLALFGLPIAVILGATTVLGLGPLQGLAEHWLLLFTKFVPDVLLIAILISIWEEIGWTGFVFSRLQARYGPLIASVMTNFLQAGIHIPLLFIVGGLTDNAITVNEYPKYLFFLFIATISNRMIMTWLYNKTRGSLPIIALFHASMNVTAGAWLVLQFVSVDDAEWVYAVFAVCALLLIVATKGRLGYRPGNQITQAGEEV